MESKSKSKAAKTEVKIIYGSFLKEKIVDVKAIESSGRWKNLLVGGQEGKMSKEPYMFGKVKRSFQVPLQSERKGGGIKIVLDNNERLMVKKYMTSFPDGITEQEFFEKELGIDLNPTLPKAENFWRGDKRGRVTLKKDGLTLNLRYPMDMLKFKILTANPQYVSPNYEERRNKATYEFMIVDQGSVISRRVEEAEMKARASKRYLEITSSIPSMKGFIKAIGRTIPGNHNEDWLKGEILTVLENSYSKFLSIVDDELYAKRVFVQEGVEAGAINKMNDKRYVLDNGVELGDLLSTISWLSDPDHQESRLRVKSQIDMANK